MRTSARFGLASLILCACGSPGDTRPDASHQTTLDAAVFADDAASLDADAPEKSAGDAGADEAARPDLDAGTSLPRDTGAPPPDANSADTGSADTGPDATPPTGDASEWLISVRGAPGRAASVNALVLSPDGAVFVLGGFVGSATLDGRAGQKAALSAANESGAAFVALYAADGQLSWAVPITGADRVSANALALMPDGGVVLSGAASAKMQFGQTSGAPVAVDVGAPAASPFLARYTASGTVSWAIVGGCAYSAWNAGNAVAVTADAIYWAGSINEGVKLPTSSGNPISLAGEVNGAGFIARYTHAGVAQWALQITGGESLMNGVAANAEAAFIGGQFRFQSTFDSKVGVGSMRSSSNYYEDGFVARYRADGKLEWVNQIGGIPAIASWGRVYQVALDAKGRLMVAGVGVGSGGENTISFESTSGMASHSTAQIFVAGYSTSGVLDRLYELAGESTGLFAGETTFVVGTYRAWTGRFVGSSGAARTLPLPPMNDMDGFLVGFNDAGAISSLDGLSGAGRQTPLEVAARADGLYVVGNYEDEIKLRTLSAQGTPKLGTGFIARLKR